MVQCKIQQKKEKKFYLIVEKSFNLLWGVR